MKPAAKFFKDILKGDKSAVARAITIVENDSDYTLLKKLFPFSGRAYYIGITGPPGAGKSTLVNAIAKLFLKRKKRIGIIAVDPTSPFSGGALLGDRVRMADLALNKNVFIRSMASRGSLGGLAKKTKDAALVLDAAGMDYILIETIGVGQVELDIAQVCDTTLVVLVPESGDSIQAMKAGLLEIGDIIVVNKGDREGCERLIMELKFAFDLRNQLPGWSYPIVKTIATEGYGIEQVVSRIEAHQAYLNKTGKFEVLRKEHLFSRINELIEEKIKNKLRRRLKSQPELKKIIDDIYSRRRNPFDVAENLLKDSGIVP